MIIALIELKLIKCLLIKLLLIYSKKHISLNLVLNKLLWIYLLMMIKINNNLILIKFFKNHNQNPPNLKLEKDSLIKLKLLIKIKKMIKTNSKILILMIKLQSNDIFIHILFKLKKNFSSLLITIFFLNYLIYQINIIFLNTILKNLHTKIEKVLKYIGFWKLYLQNFTTQSSLVFSNQNIQ
jgi:hypothetical protein